MQGSNGGRNAGRRQGPEGKHIGPRRNALEARLDARAPARFKPMAGHQGRAVSSLGKLARYSHSREQETPPTEIPEGRRGTVPVMVTGKPRAISRREAERRETSLTLDAR